MTSLETLNILHAELGNARTLLRNLDSHAEPLLAAMSEPELETPTPNLTWLIEKLHKHDEAYAHSVNIRLYGVSDQRKFRGEGDLDAERYACVGVQAFMRPGKPATKSAHFIASVESTTVEKNIILHVGYHNENEEYRMAHIACTNSPTQEKINVVDEQGLLKDIQLAKLPWGIPTIFSLIPIFTQQKLDSTTSIDQVWEAVANIVNNPSKG